jgi:hypothetical protein
MTENTISNCIIPNAHAFEYHPSYHRSNMAMDINSLPGPYSKIEHESSRKKSKNRRIQQDTNAGLNSGAKILITAFEKVAPKALALSSNSGCI